jgi:hypothetical protein
VSLGGRLVVAAVAVALVVFVLRLVRRGGLRAKYSMLWLAIATAWFVVAIVPGLLDRISEALGVEYPPALFLLLAVAFLLAVVIHVSWELTRLEARSRVLAEEIALLRRELETGATRRPGAGSRRADPR